MKRNIVVLKALLGLAFALSLLYVILQVQGASSLGTTPTALPSISPTATTVPDDYEEKRAEAADYWLRNVHKLPVPSTSPTPPPVTPYPTATIEPYPISTVEPTATEANATATTGPAATEMPLSGNGLVPSSDERQYQVNSPSVSS